MGEGCHLLRIDLPRNARFIGYRYEVQDGGQGSDCLAGKAARPVDAGPWIPS